MTNSIRILHVDDEPDFADLVATFLERQDDRIRVETVDCVAGGLDRLAAEEFDCVVSDYDMSELNGVEFLRTVRDGYPDLPFILFTGKGSEEVASEAISAGVTDYLQKGGGTGQYEILCNRITNAVEKRYAKTNYLELFSKTPVGVTILDPESGSLLDANPAFGRILGHDPETVIDEHPAAFSPPESPFDRPHYDRMIDRALEEGSHEFEWRHRARDDEDRWVQVTLSRTTIDGQDRLLGVVEDVTERKAHQQDLRRVRDLLDKTERIADVGGWEIDTETMDVFWTEHLFDLLGVDYDDEPPLDEALDVYHEEDRQIVEKAVETALDRGEPFDVEVRFRRPDGEIRWLRVQGVPTIEDGEVVTLRGAVQEITERKEHERELTRQNERLEEFASVVSHDLRSPLAVAQGRLELAREECDSDHLDDVARTHERMNALIDDLLTLASDGRLVSDPVPVDLADLTRECWSNVETAGATLRTETDRTIRADRSRLQQLLENLLLNAVEYGGDDVTVTVGDLDDGFYVEDDGPGISHEDREEVFDAGYSTSEDGTGFGLSIVQQVVDAHDWDVFETGEAPGGARFEITGVDDVR